MFKFYLLYLADLPQTDVTIFSNSSVRKVHISREPSYTNKRMNIDYFVIDSRDDDVTLWYFL